MNNYDNIFEKASGALKKLKVLGIIVSILMILLGLVSCFSPFLGQSIVIWLMVAGLFIFGIEEIASFCATPKGYRNGFTLASGIIWVVLCLTLFFSAIKADYITNLAALGAFDYFIAIMISFTFIFNAINDFCTSSKAAQMGLSKGGFIASGILGILAGIIILSFPIGAVITLEIFFSIFLIAGGISLLCRCLSYKNSK